MSLLKTCWMSAASGSVIALAMSAPVMAAGFQLWEQDGASVGNYHAGYAASANDASTAFYNPAGLTRIKNQQIEMSAVAALPSFKFKGHVVVNTVNDYDPQPVTAQGGSFGFIPGLAYATPISDTLGFGFNVVVPFGMKADYGTSTALRYLTTVTSINVIDISPSLGIKLTDKASFGFGPDVQVASGEFDQVATNGTVESDSDGINTASDTGYGYHLGFLYEFTPETRAGLSYHSQVTHNLKGKSKFTGPLADVIHGGPIISNNAKLGLTLPPYTALSIYHLVQPHLALMGSIIYTQWSRIQNLHMQNVAGILLDPPSASNDLNVVIPQYFRNTWNLSVGADYFLSEKITLRGGLGFDQSPVKAAYRNPQMPDNNRFAIALGSHYQSTKTLGFDFGWTHILMNEASIHPPMQVTGDERGRAVGKVNGGADVFALQLTWDIA